jgi:hypothetical protein
MTTLPENAKYPLPQLRDLDDDSLIRISLRLFTMAKQLLREAPSESKIQDISHSGGHCKFDDENVWVEEVCRWSVSTSHVDNLSSISFDSFLLGCPVRGGVRTSSERASVGFK